MKNGYLLTEYSRNDLIKIRHYTFQQWGSRQSTHYLDQLKKTLNLLSEMPLMGKHCQDDLVLDVFRFPFNSHMIYYSSLPNNKIMIVAVLHQGMSPQQHLDHRL